MTKNNSKNDDVRDIFNHWNSERIIVHKTLDKQMGKVIQCVLDDGHDPEDLKECITLYAKVLRHPQTRWTYKWRIEEFFKRVPGFRHFLAESEPLQKWVGNSFDSGGTTPPVSPVSPALKVDFLKRKKP